jgi:hypothetical protein
MHSEFGAAYQQYRGDHEKMNTIRHFDEMATQHGTTLDRALTNYVTMEQKLRQDVVGGLDVIVNNLNLRTPDGHKLTLPDICQARPDAVAGEPQADGDPERPAGDQPPDRRAAPGDHGLETGPATDAY